MPKRTIGPPRSSMSPPSRHLRPNLRELAIYGLISVSVLGIALFQTPEVKAELHTFGIGCHTEASAIVLHQLIEGQNDFRLKSDSEGDVIYGLPGEPILDQKFGPGHPAIIDNPSLPQGQSETFTFSSTGSVEHKVCN